MAREPGLEKTGNWREIQALTTEHNPVVLHSSEGTGAATTDPSTISVSGKDGFDIKLDGQVTIKGDSTDQGFTYNYKNGGNDWGNLVSSKGVENNCGNSANQSPVNLL